MRTPANYILPAVLMSCAFLATAAYALAATNAGFSQQAVFLSHSSITEGESVTAYANIINNSNLLFSGKVGFDDNGTSLGTVAVSLPAGETSVVSVSWNPPSGVRTVSAVLEDGNGTALSHASATLDVAQNLPSPEVASSSIDAYLPETSMPFQQGIANISPQVAAVTAPLFGAIDAGRSSALSVINRQINNTRTKLPGAVSQSPTPQSAPNGWLGWALAIVWTLYFYVLTVLGYLVSSAALCYAALIIFMLWFLYWLYRRMRPRYRY